MIEKQREKIFNLVQHGMKTISQEDVFAGCVHTYLISLQRISRIFFSARWKESCLPVKASSFPTEQFHPIGSW